MINISKARSLVEGELSKMSHDRPPESKRVIVNVLPIEGDLGWIFFYNTKAFAETQDPMYELAGNAPIIVDREDGSLHVTGTGRSFEEYVEEFRKKKQGGS
jgi:hypothetical protein